MQIYLERCYKMVIPITIPEHNCDNILLQINLTADGEFTHIHRTLSNIERYALIGYLNELKTDLRLEGFADDINEAMDEDGEQ